MRIAVLSILLLLLAGFSFSADISSCTNLTSGVYNLTADVSGAQFSYYFGAYDACMGINGSNIVLDCGGNTIDATGDSGIAIVDSSNVTIRNCVFSGDTGIEALSLQGGRVEGCTFSNTFAGFYDLGIPGLDNLTITGNTFDSGTYGIFNFGENSTVSNNVFQGIGSVAILDWFQNNKVQGNVINNTGGFGMDIRATGTNVTDNAVTDTEDVGIYFTGVGCSISKNNISQSGSHGMQIGAGDYPAYASLISQNRISGNTGNGIHLEGSSYITASGNVIFGNANGVYVMPGFGEGTYYPNGDVVSSNTIYSNSLDAISINMATNCTVFGNAASGGTNAISINDSTYCTVGSNTAFSAANGILLYNSFNNSVSNNIVYINSQYGILLTGSFGGGSGYNNLTGNNVYTNPIGVSVYSYYPMVAGPISSDYNNLSGNTVHGNSLAGIYVRNSLTSLGQNRYYNNGYDFAVEAPLDPAGGGASLYMDSDVFDNPSGSNQNITRLSIMDIVEPGGAYAANYSAPPSPPSPGAGYLLFRGYLDISNLSAVPAPIDAIGWVWTNGDIGSFNENKFELWKYNSSGWSLINNAPDTANNYLTNLSLSPLGVFAIFQNQNCPAPIVSPGTTTMSGSYVGSPNSVTDGMACVKIASSNVVFDCSGYTIKNNGTAGTTSGVFVENGLTNVTVRNCANISGYNYGVYLRNTNNSRILNNTASGLNRTDGAAFNIFTGSNNAVSDNKANSIKHAVLIQTSNGNNVTGNNVTDCSSDAIQARGSFNRFADNNATLCSVGVWLGTASSASNVISGNRFYGLYQYGVQLVSAGNGNIISGNNLTGNSIHGIWLQNTNNTNITGNNVSGNVQYGIDLVGSNSNRITGNTGNSNNQGIRLESSSNGNLVDLNTVKSNINFGMLVLNSQQNNVTRNNASLNNYGIYVSASGNRVLGNNASTNSQTGIFVTGSGSGNNLIADNLANSNTNYGIHVSSGGNNYNNLTNNTANLNGDGIRVEASQYCILRNNSAASNANNGFYIGTAAHNTLADNNVARNNGQSGFYLATSSNSILTNNTAFINPYGFYLVSGSNSNTLANNTAFSNSFYGFYLSSSSGNNLTANTAYGNSGYGFLVYSSSGNNLISNTAYGNSNFGFYVYPNSDFNTLTGNSAYGNSNYGIAIESGSGNSLNFNNASNNTLAGIYLRLTANTSVIGNNASDNPFGFYVYEANLSTLIGNAAYGNALRGIYIFDSNSTNISYDHYYNNGVDMVTESAFSHPFNLYLNGVVFDSPYGNYTNYTNITLNDSVNLDGSYSLDWASEPSVPPYPPFAGKFINISRVFGTVIIDRISWNWLDSELAAGPYAEGLFQLYRYNGSSWAYAPATLSASANTLTHQNLNLSAIYAILQVPSDEEEEGPGPIIEAYGVSIVPVCQGFIVKVDDAGNPVADALVDVTDETHGTSFTPRYTDSSGEALFQTCDIDVSARAVKEGREGEDSGFAECGFCAQCQNDSQCLDKEQCLNLLCVPINCPEGEVVNHTCVKYGCTEDADCAAGEACVAHSCQKKETPECSSDADCAAVKYCDIPAGAAGGSCKDVQAGACGEIVNHTFVAYGYECGSEAGCPQCGAGYRCVEHKCVQNDLSCPSTGLVGDSKTCAATEGGAPCILCDYVFIDPAGKSHTGKTDSKGNFALPLNLEGVYNVTLLKDGVTIKTIIVKALPATQPPDERPPTGIIDQLVSGAIWIIILGAIAAIVVLYFRRRTGKKRAI